MFLVAFFIQKPFQFYMKSIILNTKNITMIE